MMRLNLLNKCWMNIKNFVNNLLKPSKNKQITNNIKSIAKNNYKWYNIGVIYVGQKNNKCFKGFK